MYKMEQMHLYILMPFCEIYSLKSFKFKFLNQIRIKITGLPGFLKINLGPGGKYANFRIRAESRALFNKIVVFVRKSRNLVKSRKSRNSYWLDTLVYNHC